jgi:hypothetical protein
MRDRRDTLLLAGWATDVARVVSEIDRVAASVVKVDERTPDSAELPSKAVVIYIFSADTHTSSQFMSTFAYIHDHLEPRAEYLLGLDGIDPKRRVFHTIRNVPAISLAELLALHGQPHGV